jgi:chemotaxis protein CheD
MLPDRYREPFILIDTDLVAVTDWGATAVAAPAGLGAAAPGSVTTVPAASAGLSVGGGSFVFTCRGLGSCVCVALWDPTVEIGGIAHVVLPDSRRHRADPRAGMFGDRAPAAILAAMHERGARRLRIVAKIVGGASIFFAAGTERLPFFDVGCRNIASVESALWRLGVPIVGEDVGGARGRSIEFSVADGGMRIKTTDGTVKEL